jgi:hypothetical protein
VLFRSLSTCQAVRKEKDIRWQRISVKNVLERTDIRRRAGNL